MHQEPASFPDRRVRKSKYRLAISCLTTLLPFSLFLFPFAFFPLPCPAQGIITTVAGGSWEFRCDGCPATDAPLGRIDGVAVDGAGNVYAVDDGNLLVVKISTTGVLSVVAGNGLSGFSGDGGPATNASFRAPNAVAVDLAGNVYIAEALDPRIRKVSLSGIITTIAGNGKRGFSGDGGPATNASLASRPGVAVDAVGNLYIVERSNHRIRKVSPDGIITTVAGNGIRTGSIDGEGGDPADDLGDGGPATNASFRAPSALAVDAAGNLYIADTGNDRIRKVSPDGIITTITTTASLRDPVDVAVDLAGNVYVAETARHRVRKVSPDGTVTTLAGIGEFGFSGDGGLGPGAALNEPGAVAVDFTGTLYIADTENHRVRKVGLDGIITTVAGNGGFKFSGDGGPATSTAFDAPRGVAVDVAGNVYVADAGNNRIRRLSPGGIITTLAGTGVEGYSGDGGPAASALLDLPSAVAVDAIGNVYIAELDNQVIRKVSPNGIITTVAGSGSYGFDGDGGPAIEASITNPFGVAVDAAGAFYIADSFNERIRKVSPGGIITTVAGSGIRTGSIDGEGGDPADDLGDGGPATSASFFLPFGVTVDTAGNLYIADWINRRIRKVSPDGAITTVAGGGMLIPADGGPATSAGLGGPTGIVVDTAGNLYIADRGDDRIRRVGPDGIITTVAGIGIGGFSGDGGPATNASLNQPSSVAVDATGNLYIADQNNDRIRKVLATVPSFSVGPASLSFSAPAGAPVVAAQQIVVGSAVAGLAWGAQVSTESGGGWLSVSPTAGSAPGVIAVSVNVANLAPGSYQGRVTVEAPLAAMPMQTVIVELTVEQALAPKLVVEPVGLTFEIPAGAGSPPAQTLRISNGGGGTLDWTARAETTVGGNWLELSPASGTASAAAPATVEVRAVVGTLAPGVYPGAVQVESPTTNQTETIQVTLLVAQAKQSILVSQSGLLITGVEGGGAVPSQSFGIVNSGEGVMDWTVEATALAGGNWLSVSPASGSSDAASTRVPLVEVAVNVTGLSAGQYSGLIRVNALGAGNSPQFATVTLDVLPVGSHPGVVVRPTNLIFATPASTFSPGSQNVRVSTAAPGRLEARSGLFTHDGGDWLEILPPNLVLSADDPRRVVVQPTLGGLSAGAYRGQLALQFSDLDNPSQVVPSQKVQVLFLVVSGAVSGASAALYRTSGQGLTAFQAAQPCVPQQLHAVHRTLGSNFASPVGWPSPIEVQVVDDCGSAVGNATVVASFSSGDPPLALASLRNGSYVGTWRPVRAAAQVTVTVRASLPPLADAEVRAQGAVQANPTAPALFAGGVVNGASFAPGEALAPGSIVALFGRNLAQGKNDATQLPLETTLGGATLNIGGVEAPLFFSSGGQINAQIPFELAAASRPHVVVRTGRDGSGPEAVTVPETITLAAARPGVFTTNQQGTGQGAILDVQGRLVDTTSPAVAGEVVQVFCTGLGATEPRVTSGKPAPAAEPLARVVVPVEAQVGGQPATVHFAGLAPGFVGLYQVNVEIPAEIAPGSEVPLVLLQNGVPSNTVTLAIQ